MVERAVLRNVPIVKLRHSMCFFGPLLVAVACASGTAFAQRWQELQGRSRSGVVEMRQAVLDAGTDTLALLVSSHPDDRYLLPAIYLRFVLGVRVAVLIVSRGGGGQNSCGPETGDALERIRTLETEAGCGQFDGAVYYLDRADRGYRRTAAETFGEWGRDDTLRGLVRMVREIRPDFVVTTHSAEELHGHDLAIAELLPIAAAQAGDAKVETALPPHRVHGLFLGALISTTSPAIALRADQFEPNRGGGLRRLAYELLARCHVSPGAPDPMAIVFPSEVAFVAVTLPWPSVASWTKGLPSLFDRGIWPGAAEKASDLQDRLGSGLRQCGEDPSRLIDHAAEAIRALEGTPCLAVSEAARRRARRIEALQRVVLHANAIQIEIETKAGTFAVPGEPMSVDARIIVGGPRDVDAVRLVADNSNLGFEPMDGDQPSVAKGGVLAGVVTYRVPPAARGVTDPMEASFHGDRFIAPLRLQFVLSVCGVDIPVVVSSPIEARMPLELTVWPRMLLCPTHRDEVKFSVEVVRNSVFPVVGKIDVRAPAGYQVRGDRTELNLQARRGETFDFSLRPPADRKSGVDVIRIAIGESRVALPLHKIDVQIDPQLRIGLVRNRDDALVSAIGVGGFGLHWSELSDTDLAVRDLSEFDTIVVEARALRDRPAARRSYRRLLDFCGARGKRLVVFYHKDVEFDPPGEGFIGAPFQPFAIGKERVTHADAPVTVLRSDHCLLQLPNQIFPSDWDGWEQERALYFPSSYSSEYQEILQMGDPGLPAKRSALLYARVGPRGEGEYVYCALALWRQLKKLHPGAVRLLANLLTPQPAAK